MASAIPSNLNASWKDGRFVRFYLETLAAMELPAALFGKRKFQPGDKIELDTTLLTHFQAYRVDWKGSFTLR